MHALSEAIRADRLDRETIVAQLAALEGTISDCYTGEDREEILDLVRRLPEMDEDELIAAADRIAVRLQRPGERLLPAEDRRVARPQVRLRPHPEGSAGPQAVTTTSEDEAPDELETPPSVRADAYISADIEADGPIPGPYSMLSLGMCIAGEQDASGTFRPIQPESARFYRELKPISDRFEQGALDAIAGSGIDRERLKTEGADPADAMTEAARWVLDLADGRRPVFVGWPMGYDWMFLTWYFHSFSEIGSPFSFASALDMKTMVYVGTHRVLDELGKRHLPEEVVPKRPHTHHALDDAIEQAELFQNLRRWRIPAFDDLP